jgi:hypothetical protein
MSIIDLSAIVRNELKPLRVQLSEDLRRIVREELAAREQERFLDTAQLAKKFGISAKALSMRLRRGSKLNSIALRLDGRTVWRSTDLDELLRGEAK